MICTLGFGGGFNTLPCKAKRLLLSMMDRTLHFIKTMWFDTDTFIIFFIICYVIYISALIHQVSLFIWDMDWSIVSRQTEWSISLTSTEVCYQDPDRGHQGTTRDRHLVQQSAAPLWERLASSRTVAIATRYWWCEMKMMTMILSFWLINICPYNHSVVTSIECWFYFVVTLSSRSIAVRVKLIRRTAYVLLHVTVL